MPKAGGLVAGKIALNAILNYDSKNTFGSQFKWNTSAKKSRVVLGAVHKLRDDITLKGKVNILFN